MCKGCDEVIIDPTLPVRPDWFVRIQVAGSSLLKPGALVDEELYVCKGCGNRWFFDGLLSKWVKKPLDS